MKYMTVAEFAAHMRIDESTVRRHIRKGLPHVRVGPKLVRIIVADAEKWLSEKPPLPAQEQMLH